MCVVKSKLQDVLGVSKFLIANNNAKIKAEVRLFARSTDYTLLTIAFAQRRLVLAISPVIILLSVQAWHPTIIGSIEQAILPFVEDVPLLRSMLCDPSLPRFETLLVVTAFAH
jgi:hypothetical protein